MNLMLKIFFSVFTIFSIQGMDFASAARVYRVTPQNDNDFEALGQIHYQYDVWRHSRGHGDHSHVMIEETEESAFTDWLKDLRLRHDVIVEDVDRLLASRSVQASATDREFDMGQYHTLDEINKQMDILVKTHPFVTKIEVARSYEGRSIYGLKVKAGSRKERPAMWIDGGIHAREWISPSTVLYIANKLITTYGTEPNVTRILNGMDVYLIPVINVDGYLYTWINQTSRLHRLWRKTRSVDPDTGCIGTDPNRNFNYHWAEQGASYNACDTTYAGPYPFSESESMGIALYLMSIKNIHLYLSLHSYSQALISPNGFNKEVPDNFNEMMTLCERAVSAAEKVDGTEYKCGSIARLIYPCAGTSIDWAHYVAGARYTYGMELRDKGAHGFLLPVEEIIPTGEETLQALIVMALSAF